MFHGGRGARPVPWPQGLAKMYCGYAGGLGPDNLQEQLSAVAAAAAASQAETLYWVDMQFSSRGASDRFDLSRGRHCLEIAREHKASTVAARPCRSVPP